MLAQNTCFHCHKHDWKSSWHLIKNIWFPAGKCPDIFFFFFFKTSSCVSSSVKISQCLIKHTQQFHTNKCWCAVLSSEQPSPSTLPLNSGQVMSAWCDTYCRSFAKHSYVTYPWFAERYRVTDWAARRETLSAPVELRWSEWTASGSFAITRHHPGYKSIEKALLLKAASRNKILVRGATESILTWSITARPRTGSSLQRLEHHWYPSTEHQRHQWSEASTQRQREP